MLAVWDTASRATEIERTLATLDPERMTAEYKRAKRSGDEPGVEAALGPLVTAAIVVVTAVTIVVARFPGTS